MKLTIYSAKDHLASLFKKKGLLSLIRIKKPCFILPFMIVGLMSKAVHAQNFRASAQASVTSGITTLTISKPTGTTANDVMIAAITIKPYTATITAPAGWTLIKRTNQTLGTTSSQATYWKAAVASEPTTYAWTLGSSTGAAGGISTFYNVNTTNPVNANNGQATASSTTHATPTVTTTVVNTMVVATNSISASATWTPPSGMTEGFDISSSAGTSLEMSYVAQAALAATGTKTATASTSATGVAQILTLVSNLSAAISYTGTPYCSNAGTAVVTLTGTTGGTYSSTTGLSISSTTGAITLATSIAGTYTVTYTYGGAYPVTTTTNITVQTGPSATISYAGSPYCHSCGTASVTFTGTAGGSYSSTAGLSLNAATGDIAPGTSTAGTYIVTYTVAASGACGGYTTTTSITVNAVTTKYYVNDNSSISSVYTTAIGNDANSGTASAPFLTINKAISVANAGDTIYVDAGSYSEQVNPNKNITILGSNAAISPNTGTRNAESILNNSAGNAINVSTVNRVVIKGFKMTGNSGYSIISNTSNNKITLEKNFFDATPGTNFNSSDSLLVIDNRFNNLGAGEGFFVAGSYNGTTGTYLEAYNNTWINSSSSGMNIGNAKGDIYNNTFSAVSYYGILVASYSSLNITRNIFSGIINPDTTVNTYGAAIRFYTPTAGMVTNITNNYFNNSYIGIAVRPTDDVTGKTITITNNSFSGNTFANINHTGAGQLNATCNWFGTTNIVALSSTIFGNVLYCTFLNNGTDNDAVTPGFQPVPNSCTALSATISYTGTPYCSSAGTASVTSTGNAGGTYSSTTLGAALNTATGVITLASAIAGTHTITYTIPALGGCSAYTTTTTVTITTQPYATGSYPGNPYCSNSGTATPTGSVSGAIGTFSSTTGISIDANYGTINLGASTAGTYTISYTVPASGGCAVYTSTRSITIAAAPSATITYSGSPYCATGTASATLTGTAGGTYSSTTGLSIDATTGAVNLATSTAGTYTVTYTVAAASPCGQFQTITGITINPPGLWTGAVSTAWSLAANWQCNILPASTTNVTIPSGLLNYPTISSGTAAVNNLTLQSGATITNNATLQIASTATTTGGKITATAGKVEFNGTVAQTVPANLFSSNTVKDLVITNAAGVTLAGAVRVTGTVDFGNVNNSVLYSNGYLTLVSTATNSADLLDVTNGGVNTGNTVSGNVTVERYMQGKRAYRFLTSPVNTATSYKANWMEGVNNIANGTNINPVPNYGTQITGTGGSANGFDVTNTNNPSMYTFNPVNQTWIAVPNTNGLFSAGTGYRILVRGSRSVNLLDNYAVPSVTTLRATGTLVTGSVIFTAAGGGGTAGTPALSAVTGAYSLIANPYASSIDWLKLYNTSTNLSPTMYIFDPTISGSNGRGGYVSYNGLLKVKNIVSSLISNDLQSGQAIFVQSTGPNPSITFQEAYKSTTFLPVFRTANDVPHLNVELLLPGQVDSTGSADGTVVYFSNDYSNSIGDEDSYKLINQDENIAVLRNGTTLSIEGRKPVNGSDSVPLKMWQLTLKNYTLKVALTNFADNVEAYLEDNFLHTSSPLANETLVPFDITSDAASNASDRFKIVFESLATLPVKLTNIKAYEKNKGVQVEWTAESESNMESYEAERSADIQHFETVCSAKAKNNAGVATTYNCFDINPTQGDNYYRIKSIEKSGDIKYSEVIKVHLQDVSGNITAAAIPGITNSFTVNFKNIEQGDYNVKLISSTGQKLYEGSISHGGGSATKLININNSLPAGVYLLQLTNKNDSKNITLLFQ